MLVQPAGEELGVGVSTETVEASGEEEDFEDSDNLDLAIKFWGLPIIFDGFFKLDNYSACACRWLYYKEICHCCSVSYYTVQVLRHYTTGFTLEHPECLTLHYKVECG